MVENDFLPIDKEGLRKRGWDALDIILISGDAYVDHPSYGAAVISRVLEHNGFRVGIIAQPDWKSTQDVMRLGEPRLFFAITSGNTDSLVANYTANKKPRKSDEYSPGNKVGLRPDRAVIVYANLVRQAYKDVPIVLGGIEASLRRLAHYDYWDNSVRRSILIDSRADILVYGMGEKQIIEIARRLKAGESPAMLNNIRGTAVVRRDLDFIKEHVKLPAYEEVMQNKESFGRAFKIAYGQMDPFSAKTLAQKQDTRWAVQFPPALPLLPQELDAIYELPYMRRWHPIYKEAGGVKGLETVSFSLTAHRGCCGECSFCALYFHQGRIVQSRTRASVVREAWLLASQKDFKGTITDVGGPTANLYAAHCELWKKKGYCADKKCLFPRRCAGLKLGYDALLQLYQEIQNIPGVKHVFIGSGLRYDLLVEDQQQQYLRAVCKSHISGLMKVAPEHCSDNVLTLMNKPSFAVYEQFVTTFRKAKAELGKELFLVNYFLSGHPGASLKEALKLALYLAKRGIHPEQIQDFIPSPMTLAGCIYYTEKDPFTGKKVYVARTFRERKMQRALIQYYKPANRKLIVEALKELGALHVLKKLNPRSKPR
ncbi:MAG: YgiQ family radical SAM protein [Candidatus Omnitrophota bacterium]